MPENTSQPDVAVTLAPRRLFSSGKLLTLALVLSFGCSEKSGSEYRDYRSSAPAVSKSGSEVPAKSDAESSETEAGRTSDAVDATRSDSPGSDRESESDTASSQASPDSDETSIPAKSDSIKDESAAVREESGELNEVQQVSGTVPPQSESIAGSAEGGIPESDPVRGEVSAAGVASVGNSSPASSETGSGDSPESASDPASKTSAAAEEVAAEPRSIELLIPDKKFRREKNSAAVRVTYDDIDLLKILNMEPVPVDAANHFPVWLKAMDGQQIRIRGFMYPTFEATGLTAFTLARDNGICCFVRQPKIYDIIAVELGPGITSDYIEGKPFDVEGIFRIQPEADEKELYRLYRIENARVIR